MLWRFVGFFFATDCGLGFSIGFIGLDLAIYV